MNLLYIVIKWRTTDVIVPFAVFSPRIVFEQICQATNTSINA